MANEVTLPETRVTEPSAITTHNTRPESPVNVVKPQVQLAQETALKPLQVGGNNMAEVDTNQLSQEHADIRREGAEHTSTIRYNIKEGTNEGVKETLKAGWAGVDATKDARYDINSRVTNSADRVVDRVEDTKDTILARSWDMGRDTMDLRAQVTGIGYQVRDGFFAAAKDSEINALKTQVELAKQTTYLSDKIDDEGEKTRCLINRLNDDSLNRHLIERNAEIVEERGHARHWRGHYDQAQFANLTSQLQAFQSQLAETRQGMVNFGTMAGVGQTSTANNVR